MEEKDFNTLDQILNVAITNLYTISKPDQIICLSNVNFDDDRHWVILNLVSYVCTYMDRIAFLDMSIWQFYKMRKRIKNKKMKRVRNNNGMTCDHFIEDIEKANSSISTPFLTIADLYYNRKVKA